MNVLSWVRERERERQAIQNIIHRRVRGGEWPKEDVKSIEYKVIASTDTQSLP